MDCAEQAELLKNCFSKIQAPETTQKYPKQAPPGLQLRIVRVVLGKSTPVRLVGSKSVDIGRDVKLGTIADAPPKNTTFWIGVLDLIRFDTMHGSIAIAPTNLQAIEMTLAGLEPAIFGSEDQRLIH